jgi:hypothetical protein
VSNSARDLGPSDFLHFVETDEFRDDWEQLGLNVERDLWELQTLIMSGPEKPAVIPGTGGLRKMRFAGGGGRGKSGGIRVCYAYFKKYWTVLLVIAYSKSRKDNLTAIEKTAIKRYLNTIEDWLDTHRKNEK